MRELAAYIPAMKEGIFFALMIASGSAIGADGGKSKEQWRAEAVANAEKLFAEYHVICDGKVVVASSSGFYQFSGGKAKTTVLGTYAVSSADILNGKLWSGRMVVDIGDSARLIRRNADGSRFVGKWDYGREVEFDYKFDKDQWQATGQLFSYSTYNFDLKPGVTCSAAGL